MRKRTRKLIGTALILLFVLIYGPVAMALHGLTSPVFWLAAAGVLVAFYLYMVNTALPARLQSMFRPLYTVLDNKYYMDWFNENVLARAARGLGVGLWKGGDQAVIDGTLVNGSARLVGVFAAITRRLQTGYLYHYALAMIVGVFILLTWFVAPWSALLGR